MIVRVLDMEFPVEVTRERDDMWVGIVHMGKDTVATQGFSRDHLKHMVEEAVSLMMVEVIDD